MAKPRIPSASKTPRAGVSTTNGRSAQAQSDTALMDQPEEAHLRLILGAMVAFRDGDFTVRLPADWAGTEGRIAGAFNQTIAQKQRISLEVSRLSEMVGKQGRLKQRMTLPGALGGWAEDADSMNTLIEDLVRPTTESARTIGAVVKGSLGQSMD